MASESTIAIEIRTALAQHLKRDVSKVRPQDRLREDLGLDSLAMIELLFKIEEHFDLEIPNEDLSRVTTVADVTAYVEEKLGTRRQLARRRCEGESRPQPRRRQPWPPLSPRRTGPPRPGRSPRARPPRSRRSRLAAKKKAAANASAKAAAKKKGSRRA